MIKNFWQFTNFYCLNHEKPISMKTMKGDSVFYACPHYMIEDEKHPDGHKKDEKMCTNRISFTGATAVIDKFMKIVDDDTADGIVMDYTGMTFKYNGIDVRILKYSPNDVRIGILNKKATQ
jgi:hypothetical protein